MNHRLLLSTVVGLCSSLPAQEDLPPGTLLLPESALPEYEAAIDHARLVENVNKGVLKLGQEVYQQVCHNCHGDVNLPGSIPNAMRFAEGSFQHGGDPHTMYQTLTRGWRLMVPQVQLTPREKYAVIHYIRDHFLARHNREQLFEITETYLEGLPEGDGVGPDPVKREPWKDMDYGNFLIGTFDISTAAERGAKPPQGQAVDFVPEGANIAYKAIAQRLDPGPGGVSQGSHWVAFEHDTMRIAGVWKGEGFIDWNGINFNGRHVVRPRTVGEPVFETQDAPGWANPETGRFEDARFVGLDGRRYGPLPRSWAHYKGLHVQDGEVVIRYTVGKTEVLEQHGVDANGVFVRWMHLDPSGKTLKLRIADAGVESQVIGGKGIEVAESDGFVVATLPASKSSRRLAIAIGPGAEACRAKPRNLKPLLNAGAAQWPDRMESPVIRGAQEGPFQWDSFQMPVSNPWKSRLRASGLDFTPDGRSAIVCCWDGDVWRVGDLLDETAATVTWQRIASGLYQPLGVKIVDGEILVTCRDQIVRLLDLNGDGETDHYESVNSDHQVTEHFHEFAMGLQADEAGNLFYAKSARHARPPLVEQHGTLIKVTADGLQTEILARGFRAANGVCRNPDGSFFVTDQEGHWNPMNRINQVIPGDRFYGNMWGYGAPDDASDSAMEAPLCWVDKGFDRSPAELLWAETDAWGELNGSLLHLSYGHGRIEIVPHEEIDGQLQGGLCRLPVPDFPTGTMRGRFHPEDGQLYLCGMAAWGTAQMQLPGGFYRVRRTSQPVHLPTGLKARSWGLEVTFSDPVEKPEKTAFSVRSWALKRSASYGSKHHDERSHEVTRVDLSEDGRVLKVGIQDMAPVWQMALSYELTGVNGEPVVGEVQNTIHHLGDAN